MTLGLTISESLHEADKGFQTMTVKTLVIAIYALAILLFGLLGLKKVKTFTDYFLAGRSVGAWMTAFT